MVVVVVCCELATHRLTLLPGHLLDKGCPPVGRSGSAKYEMRGNIGIILGNYTGQHWHYTGQLYCIILWPNTGQHCHYTGQLYCIIVCPNTGQHWHYAGTARGATCNNPSRHFVPQVSLAKGTNSSEERQRTSKPISARISHIEGSLHGVLELIFDNFFCSTLHTDINIAYTIQQKKGLKTKECLGGNARSVVGSKKASWQAEPLLFNKQIR